MPRPEDFKTDEERQAFLEYLTEYLMTPVPTFLRAEDVEHVKNDDGTVTFKIYKEEE
ncbi:hypothetical protein AB0K16_22115 [Nonomuraea jabiensis]|uniref:hypothetical protein n=1 Tax=Nonomuraea jabiensis TaxID=882448 RepID=UPI003430CE7F